MCWETKYDASGVVQNRADLVKLKGPAPAAGGSCQMNTDCARPAGTASCGPNAFCNPPGQCVDPDQSSAPCNPDVPTPPPGGCIAHVNCASVGTCGATAFCGANQYCGDPGAGGTISKACSTDADCPGSPTTGEQMVCHGGTECVELCGTTDRCPFATMIPAAGGTFMGTTVGGTAVLEACFSATNGRERTFAWTPSTSGVATLTTCGSTFDTVLSIRQGGCEGSELQCNDDDSACGFQSVVIQSVTAGTTYTIIVDALGGSGGAFTLNVTPP
jgi:hypothetical protein